MSGVVLAKRQQTM